MPDAENYSWTIWSIGSWLHLAEVWNRQGIVVLEHLEEITFDLKQHNRRLTGPKMGKAGHRIMDEDL